MPLTTCALDKYTYRGLLEFKVLGSFWGKASESLSFENLSPYLTT